MNILRWHQVAKEAPYTVKIPSAQQTIFEDVIEDKYGDNLAAIADIDPELALDAIQVGLAAMVLSGGEVVLLHTNGTVPESDLYFKTGDERNALFIPGHLRSIIESGSYKKVEVGIARKIRLGKTAINLKSRPLTAFEMSQAS